MPLRNFDSIGDSAPIASLEQATTIAREIVDTIKSNSDLEINFKRLADGSEGLILRICTSCKEVPGDKKLDWPQQEVEDLVLKLKEILGFVKEQSRIGEFLCDPLSIPKFERYCVDVKAAMSQFERATEKARVKHGKVRQGIDQATAQENKHRRQDGRARTESKEELKHINIADQDKELQLLGEKKKSEKRKAWIEEEVDNQTLVSEPESEGEESGEDESGEDESNEETEEESDSEASIRRTDTTTQVPDKAKQKTRVRPAPSMESASANIPTPPPISPPIPQYFQPSPFQPQHHPYASLYPAGPAIGMNPVFGYHIPPYTLYTPPPNSTATNLNSFNNSEIRGKVKIQETTLGAQDGPSLHKPTTHATNINSFNDSTIFKGVEITKTTGAAVPPKRRQKKQGKSVNNLTA